MHQFKCCRAELKRTCLQYSQLFRCMPSHLARCLAVPVAEQHCTRLGKINKVAAHIALATSQHEKALMARGHAVQLSQEEGIEILIGGVGRQPLVQWRFKLWLCVMVKVGLQLEKRYKMIHGCKCMALCSCNAAWYTWCSCSPSSCQEGWSFQRMH